MHAGTHERTSPGPGEKTLSKLAQDQTRAGESKAGGRERERESWGSAAQRLQGMEEEREEKSRGPAELDRAGCGTPHPLGLEGGGGEPGHPDVGHGGVPGPARRRSLLLNPRGEAAAAAAEEERERGAEAGEEPGPAAEPSPSAPAEPRPSPRARPERPRAPQGAERTARTGRGTPGRPALERSSERETETVGEPRPPGPPQPGPARGERAGRETAPSGALQAGELPCGPARAPSS